MFVIKTYSYAFNSPMQWRDPTGMAPQKERKRDRVQNFDMNEYWIGYGLLQKSIAWLEDETAGNYYEEMNDRQSKHFLAHSLSSRLGECGGGGGGNKVENGQGYSIQNESQEVEDLNDVNQCNEELNILRKKASAKNQEAYCRIYRNRITGEVIYDDVAFGKENSNSVTPSEISLDGDEWEIIAEWHSHYGKPDDDGGDIINEMDVWYACKTGSMQIVDDSRSRMLLYVNDKKQANFFINNVCLNDKEIRGFLDNKLFAEKTYGHYLQDGHIISAESAILGLQILRAIGDRMNYGNFPQFKELK